MPPSNPAPVAAATTNTPIALSDTPLISWPTPGITRLHAAGTRPLPPLPDDDDDFTSALLMRFNMPPISGPRTCDDMGSPCDVAATVRPRTRVTCHVHVHVHGSSGRGPDSGHRLLDLRPASQLRSTSGPRGRPTRHTRSA